MRYVWFGLSLLAATLLAIPQPADANVATCHGLPATIVGTAGPDLLTGTSGPDVIAGLGGADEIYGAGGDDTICGGSGPDVIEGGHGSDAIFGGAGADAIRADPSVWSENGGSDLVRGGSSDDKIWGGAGDDDLNGGPGDDTIFGNYGNDDLSGNKKNDQLIGGPGVDVANGGSGDDHCSAESVNCDAVIPEMGWVSAYANGTTAMFRGAITHIEPIVAVDYAVKEVSSGLWVQQDGSLAVDRVWFAGTLESPGATESEWTATMVLPGARYTLAARAFDDDGDVGRLRPKQPFRVFKLELEIGLPITYLIYSYVDLIPIASGASFGRSPRDHRVVGVPADGSGDVVRLSGSLLGLHGHVDVSIRDRSTGLWLHEDGSFGAGHARLGTWCPNCTEGPDAYWLFDAELPDGAYGLHVFAIDENSAEIALQLDEEWEFTVDGAQDSTPQLAVDQQPGVVFGDTVSFTGSATDDFGVDRVLISVRDKATGLWLRNLSGPPTWCECKPSFEIDLSDRHSEETDWAIEFELLEGEYRLSVAVLDHVLHRNSIQPWLPFSVDP